MAAEARRRCSLSSALVAEDRRRLRLLLATSVLAGGGMAALSDGSRLPLGARSFRGAPRQVKDGEDDRLASIRLAPWSLVARSWGSTAADSRWCRALSARASFAEAGSAAGGAPLGSGGFSGELLPDLGCRVPSEAIPQDGLLARPVRDGDEGGVSSFLAETLARELVVPTS